MPGGHPLERHLGCKLDVGPGLRRRLSPSLMLYALFNMEDLASSSLERSPVASRMAMASHGEPQPVLLEFGS